MSWRYYAACRGRDPEMFFPSGDSDLARQQLQEAKAVCAGCAVRSVCLEWAVLAGVEHGVWGGCSEDERRDPNRRIDRLRTRSRPRSAYSVTAMSPSAIPHPGMSTCEY
jgi:WhiB family transcriptional regulator, redox-sensing transcriptional regulator